MWHTFYFKDERLYMRMSIKYSLWVQNEKRYVQELLGLDDIDYIVRHDDGSQIECSSPFRYGAMINKKIHVTQGPLMDMDDYIVKYDKYKRLATLN